YVGQPIAVIAASDRYLGEDAAALIDVAYAPLPAVTDDCVAGQVHTALLYPELGTNIVYRSVQRDGDPDFCAGPGDLVLARQFSFQRLTAVPMETRGVTARMIDNGRRLHVESTSQIPQLLLSVLAETLG